MDRLRMEIDIWRMTFVSTLHTRIHISLLYVYLFIVEKVSSCMIEFFY